jgi:hypothetical protein
MDALLKKLPGSPAVKSLAAAGIVMGLLSIPVFETSEGRLGHDLFSSDRPEVIRSGEEQIRKTEREQEQARAKSVAAVSSTSSPPQSN